MPVSHGASHSSSVADNAASLTSGHGRGGCASTSRTNVKTLEQCARVFRPRQRFESQLADACEQCAHQARAVRILQSSLAEPDRAEPALVLRDHSLLARVPFESLAVLDVRSEVRFQCCTWQRRGEPDQRLALAGVEIRDDQEFRLRDALRMHQASAASARQQIASTCAARLRDAIRIRERQKSADVGVRLARRASASCPLPADVRELRASQYTLSGAAVDTYVGGDVRIVDASAAQRLDAQPQVHIAIPALQRSKSRSPSTAAISSAVHCNPSSAPRTIM